MGAHPYGWWIILHLVLFVFWLGGDLGVYYSSRFVIKPDITPAARSTALSIMNGLDLGPKICLVLFLPSGLTLMAMDPHGAELAGYDVFSWPLVVLTWVFSFGWLASTIVDHRTHGKYPWVKRADWTIRIGLIAGLLGMAGYAFFAAEPFGVDTNPKWLAGKIFFYGLAIACGLGIRIKLKPFGPAWGGLMAQGSSPETENAIKRSIDGCVPYVLGIWGSVLVTAALGVLKPGANL
jgi:hypothetical protein